MSPYMGVGPNSAIVIVIIAWGLMISVVVGYLTFRYAIAMSLRKYLNALPDQFRNPPETLIWVNIIPGFPCLINFFVFPVLAHSYRKALEAEFPGRVGGLTLLNLAAWLYPVLYLIAFLPHVAPNWMPDKLDSAFEVCVYLGLMFSDVIVLIVMMIRFDKMEKFLRQEKPVDSTQVSPLPLGERSASS